MGSTTVEIIAEERSAAQARDRVTVALAQLGGPWLDADARLALIAESAAVAATAGADVIAFPETYLSGYPLWLARTDGAAFNDPTQKAAYAQYLDAAVTLGGPRHRRLEQISTDTGIHMIVGITERGSRTATGTTWATALTIGPQQGTIRAHRKLVPTHDERMVWGTGDAAGLHTVEIAGTRVGSLNCWENWMSPARLALAAQGEQIHVGLWPGSAELTREITRFIALESRVFSLAVAGVAHLDDVGEDFVLAAKLASTSVPLGFDGGSGIARPDGSWLVPPVVGSQGLIVADLDLGEVDAARYTFDPTGHYFRSDVFNLRVDRARRDVVTFTDSRESQ